MGRMTLGLLAIETSPFGKNEIDALIQNFFTGNWGNNLDTLLSVFSVTTLGGVIIGTFLGAVAGSLYRFIAKRTTVSYQRLHHKIEQLRNSKPSSTTPKDDA